MATAKDLNKDTYVKFIKEAKVFFNPVRDVRLAECAVLEALTKTTWFMIPLAWVPAIAYLAYQSL